MKHCLLQRQKKSKKNSAFLKVSDDWYPNIDGNKVEMFFAEKTDHIVIWGDDDFGMEKFNTTYQEFLDLKSRPFINQEILKKKGFEIA